MKTKILSILAFWLAVFSIGNFSYAYSQEYVDFINAFEWAYNQDYQVPNENVWVSSPFDSSFNVFPNWSLLDDSITSYQSLISEWNTYYAGNNWAMLDINQYYDMLNVYACSSSNWQSSSPQQYANVMLYVWYFCYNPFDFQCYDSSNWTFDNSCITSLVSSQLDSYNSMLSMYQYVKNNPSVMLDFDTVYNEINWWGSNPWVWWWDWAWDSEWWLVDSSSFTSGLSSLVSNYWWVLVAWLPTIILLCIGVWAIYMLFMKIRNWSKSSFRW